MNAKELRVEMIRHDDNGETLAHAIGVSKATLHRKISGEIKFKQDEIAKIKARYDLSTERFMEIFYGEGVEV